MQKIRKEKIGITVSPNLKREAEEIMEEVGIPTLSDFISQAMIAYIDRYKREILADGCSKNDITSEQQEVTTKTNGKKPIAKTTEYVRFK